MDDSALSGSLRSDEDLPPACSCSTQGQFVGQLIRPSPADLGTANTTFTFGGLRPGTFELSQTGASQRPGIGRCAWRRRRNDVRQPVAEDLSLGGRGRAFPTSTSPGSSRPNATYGPDGRTDPGHPLYCPRSVLRTQYVQSYTPTSSTSEQNVLSDRGRESNRHRGDLTRRSFETWKRQWDFHPTPLAWAQSWMDFLTSATARNSPANQHRSVFAAGRRNSFL
jgi:hypothetical protein